MRNVVPVVIITALLIGTAFGLALIKFDAQLEALHGLAGNHPKVRTDSADQRPVPITDGVEQQLAAIGAEPIGLGGRNDEAANKLPSLDIARISENGVSVFAGQAKPFQRISVLSGDFTLGHARADAEGNWTLVTEQKIRNPDAELSIAVGAGELQNRDQAQRRESEDAGGEARATIGEVNRRMMASLENLVEEARGSGGDAVSRPPQQVARQSTTLDIRNPSPGAGTSSSGDGATAIARSRRIPIPIQFVYREATFTDQGDRAANLLLEFLKTSRISEVTLSGHADERGSHELNMGLSRDRLKTVRDFLRAGGYDGRFVLIPKGETEPFADVDRESLAPKDLYQLDRRVELHLDE